MNIVNPSVLKRKPFTAQSMKTRATIAKRAEVKTMKKIKMKTLKWRTLLPCNSFLLSPPRLLYFRIPYYPKGNQTLYKLEYVITQLVSFTAFRMGSSDGNINLLFLLFVCITTPKKKKIEINDK